jgi:hypothetical protein
MKKKFIAAIVLAAIIALAGVGFILYKNFHEIQKIWLFTKNKIKDIKFPIVKPKSVTPDDPKTILEVPKTDVKLADERGAIEQTNAAVAKNTSTVVQKTVGVVDVEANTKEAQGAPIGNIVIENTKQREAKTQQSASKAYAELIKDIEEEKAKAAVLLTATRTEREKIQKIDALDLESEDNSIEAEDMEMELFPENRLCVKRVRKPLSKRDAEFLVAKGYV